MILNEYKFDYSEKKEVILNNQKPDYAERKEVLIKQQKVNFAGGKKVIFKELIPDCAEKGTDTQLPEISFCRDEVTLNKQNVFQQRGKK